jgi:hypothetical protein
MVHIVASDHYSGRGCGGGGSGAASLGVLSNCDQQKYGRQKNLEKFAAQMQQLPMQATRESRGDACIVHVILKTSDLFLRF